MFLNFFKVLDYVALYDKRDVAMGHRIIQEDGLSYFVALVVALCKKLDIWLRIYESHIFELRIKT